jgi:aryl-alcohol dehydrogenase-like predicted oxidoreductase
MNSSTSTVTLGLGLIGLGREWGHVNPVVPPENEVLDFLRFAFDLGITFYDNAASYGLSEIRFGKFLRTLTSAERTRVTVATKFGDHWDLATNNAYVDHSYDALRRSLDNSLAQLGHIDLLQLHKTSPAVLRSEALHRAFEYAQQVGVTRFGASVSDLESGQMVCESDFFHAIQFPYNLRNRTFAPLLEFAAQRNKFILINRPFNMGKMLYENPVAPSEAFRFALSHQFEGVVLTGTKSAQHLQQNWITFQQAQVNVAEYGTALDVQGIKRSNSTS